MRIRALAKADPRLVAAMNKYNAARNQPVTGGNVEEISKSMLVRDAAIDQALRDLLPYREALRQTLGELRRSYWRLMNLATVRTWTPAQRERVQVLEHWCELYSAVDAMLAIEPEQRGRLLGGAGI